MRERKHALGAGLRPTHGSRQLACEPRDEHALDLEHLCAEPAADVRADDAHVRGVEPEHARDDHLAGVRRLGGRPERQSAVDDLGSRRARLDRRRGHPLAHEHIRDDHVTGLEEGVVALGCAAAVRDVRAELREEQLLVLGRLLHREQGRERVVVHEHELRRVEPRGPILADHDRDDLAREADDVRGDERAHHPLRDVPGRRRPERGRVDVRPGQDLDVRERLDRGRVDAVQARVRERGADEGDGQRPFEREILDVGALASKEPRVLHAEHAIAQDAHGWRA